MPAKPGIHRRWILAFRGMASGGSHVVDGGPEDAFALDEADEGVEGDAEDREDGEEGEGAGDVELVVRLEDEEADAAVGADELTDDGADDAEDDRRVEAGEEER